LKLFSAIALLTVWSLAVTPGPARPARNQPSARKRVPPRPIVACASGVTLSLNASTASQGGLLLGELFAKIPLTHVEVSFDGEQVPVWSFDARRRSAQKLWSWHAFVPVDLEKAPHDYPLTLAAENSTGERISCRLDVRVAAGKFATESLKVAPEFVEPNPEQAERAKKEQQELRDIYARVTPERLWRGPFRVPLVGVTSGKNFGRRRVLNGQPGSPHTGVDFPAATGTPVHAAQAGRVVLAQALFFPGNTVVIDHGLGVYTLYGHLSEISVSVGDDLPAGAVLGKVGATGRVTGPHLHWGLVVHHARVNGLQIVRLQPM
jgi:murein DD-endopeptidase MepM/ murein hydrolase activator NlpD